MIILLTILMFYVLAKHNMVWEGVTAAWMFAMAADVGLTAYLIYSIWGC